MLTGMLTVTDFIRVLQHFYESKVCLTAYDTDYSLSFVCIDTVGWATGRVPLVKAYSNHPRFFWGNLPTLE